MKRPVPRMRPARRDDVARLIEIEAACYSSDQLSRRSFTRLIGSASALVIVAELDACIAGYALILLRKNSTIARLYSLAVDPAFSGRSIGRSLLGEAERQARARSVTKLRLEVRRDNDVAASLYRSAGFHETDCLPGYYSDGGDGTRYEKSLIGAIGGSIANQNGER